MTMLRFKRAPGRVLSKAVLPCVSLIIAAAAMPASAATLLDEDFESYNVGDFPTTITGQTFGDLNIKADTTSLAPNTNQIGRLTDDSGSSLLYRTASGGMDVQGEAFLYSSFDFNWDNDLHAGGPTVRLGFSNNGNVGQVPLFGLKISGQWDDQNMDTNVDPGELVVTVAPGTDGTWNTTSYQGIFEGLTRYENHHVEIFANQADSNPPLSYIGPDNNSYDIYKNSFDVWVDGVRGGGRDTNGVNDDMNYRMKGENNGGDNTEVGILNPRLGIGTVNVADASFSVEIDNLIVSTVPEPATLILFGLSAITLLAQRRR